LWKPPKIERLFLPVRQLKPPPNCYIINIINKNPAQRCVCRTIFGGFVLWLVLLCPVICTMARALWKR